MSLSRLEEELLEAVWTAHERGRSSTGAIAEESEEDILSALPGLKEKGYVLAAGDEVSLTAKGEEAARTLVRCHRLAECLMWQGLRTQPERREQVACAFEHVLLPEIVDSICVLLGHPRLCPQGKPIPPGQCCEEARASVGQALASLAALEPGRTVTIACLRPSEPDQVARLLALGFLPGKEITVLQARPAMILRLGGGEVAVDREMAAHVYVWTHGLAPAGARRRGGRRWRRWGRRGAWED